MIAWDIPIGIWLDHSHAYLPDLFFRSKYTNLFAACLILKVSDVIKIVDNKC